MTKLPILKRLLHRLRRPVTRRRSRLRRLTESLERRELLTIITVTSAEDNLIEDGLVTLREALQAANTDLSVDGSLPGNQDDIIAFDPSLDGEVIFLNGTQLQITSNVVIEGNEADKTQIDGALMSRVFDITNSATDVTIDGLTISNGQIDVVAEGGAGIRSQLLGTLTVSNSIMFGNTALGQNDGGAIATLNGDLEVFRTTIFGNFSADDGGAIAGLSSDITITESTIADNSSLGIGAGIVSRVGSLTVDSSTLSGNSADGDGGGVALLGGTGIFINATISGNQSLTRGGGIFNDANRVDILFSTITGNTAPANQGSGVLSDFLETETVVQHSIIAGNTNTDVDTGQSVPQQHTFESRGRNLVGSGNAVGSFDNNDQTGLTFDALRITELQSNGGHTASHAPFVGSPAVNAPIPGSLPTSDQRGAPFLRLSGTGLDIGAVERQPLPDLSLVVTTLDDELDDDPLSQPADLSLREALLLADVSGGPDIITFAPSLLSSPRVLQLNRGELQIRDAVTIAGPGADLLTIDANQQSRIFHIDDGLSAAAVVEISGLTLTGGMVTDGNPGIFSPDDFGGAIYSVESLTVRDARIADNAADRDGGGIYAEGATTVINTEIVRNSSHFGGGILSRGQLTVEDSTVSNNTAVDSGGGILSVADAEITRSTVSNNSASILGGGIRSDALLTVTASTISGNAALFGGGVTSLADATFHSSTVSGNTAAANGGGLRADRNLTLVATTVTANAAASGGAGVSHLGNDGTSFNAANTLLVLNTVENLSGGNPNFESPNSNLNSSLFVDSIPNLNIGPLRNNGGPTATHALATGSSAIDAGDNLASGGITTDQRGVALPEGGDNDIGAYELVFLPSDFGDAPDTAAGTGTGNYQTLLSDGGPSHTMVSGLFLGEQVEGDDGTWQNDAATADDASGPIRDDEDGVLSPLDLHGTIGAAPTITLLATNTSGSAATLSGWIDYNQDGVFENATERAQAVVLDGTTDSRFTLTFPAIPSGSTGTTYARFRLSTDSAGESSTGSASDGEVEDYQFAITAPSSGIVASHQKISDTAGGFDGILDNSDFFGDAVAHLGDLDGDGVDDVAVGASLDDDGGAGRGAVWILFMNADGTVRNEQKISDTAGGFQGTLDDGDVFGTSVTSVGDLDGNGVTDLAVGARGDDDGGTGQFAFRGAVWVLFLNDDGTVNSHQKISDTEGDFTGTLQNSDLFGRSVTSPGDLNGDGIADLAVGAREGGSGNEGAVWVLFLNADGTVQSHQEISNGQGGFSGLTGIDEFGTSITSPGDVDGDGIADLAVGAYSDDDGGSLRGAVWVLFLKEDGTVKSHQKISSTQGSFTGTLDDADRFGSAVAATGDVDGDGVVDFAVGAAADDDDGSDRGAVWLLLLNEDGTVKSHQKISDTEGGFTGDLDNFDLFGSSLASLGDLNGDGLPDLAVGARFDADGGFGRGAVYILNLDLPMDYGDAPDIAAGSAAGDYRTTKADNGPGHRILSGLHLGATVDGFGEGALQNARANADDVNSALPIDEDGVLSPLDLHGTVGAAPTITLLATNTSGGEATLSGWIDYNQDGEFDNATERAQVMVTDGSTDERFTLVFPAIPEGSTGTTYARFRLSTDAAAADSTGSATDGEVEDYVFKITAASNGSINSILKIASETNGGPAITDLDQFGVSAARVGDVDGDGVDDLAVGAWGDDTAGPGRGSISVLLLNTDGSVKSFKKIASEINGGPALANHDFFGYSVTAIGDLDGDGIPDLAVGAYGDDTVGASSGAVHVLFLNSDATVKSSTKIASGTNGGPTLDEGDRFGVSVAQLGDLDGDGVPELVVGARGDDTGSRNRGAVHVLFLNSDGTAQRATKIASDTGGGPALARDDSFGISVANLGDVDGDGVVDIAVGTYLDDTGGGDYADRGAVYVLFLNPDGTARTPTKIASNTSGGPTLSDDDRFGRAVSGVGDLNGDGVPDLAVGAYGDDTQGNSRGAVHVLLLDSQGTAQASTKIASGSPGAPSLNDDDRFGVSIANLGDLNGDGFTDLAVGAFGDDTGGNRRGAVHVLFLAAAQADLRASSFDAVTDHVLNGQTHVSFTVENTGAAAAAIFDTHVVWSVNDVLGDADDMIVSGSATTFAGLAVGASESKTISLQLDKAKLYAHALDLAPAGRPAGTVSADVSRLFLVIDVNNDIAEADEVNNSVQGHLTDSDNITYFPWDTNGNGVVTPVEALDTIRAVTTPDVIHDFDGNGVVTPLEALAVLQRIGYVRDHSVIDAAPAHAKALAVTAKVAPPEIAGVAWNTFMSPPKDEAVEFLFTNQPSDEPIAIATSPDDTASDDAFVRTEWLDVI